LFAERPLQLQLQPQLHLPLQVQQRQKKKVVELNPTGAKTTMATSEPAPHQSPSHSQSRDDNNSNININILNELSIDEKISLISGKSFWSTSSCLEKKFPHLASIYLSDGPHGLRKCTPHSGFRSQPGTCFPTACALANSWNEKLLHEFGVSLSEECEHNNVSVLLGPGMNIKRHPFGGRNFEYFSEDPLLSGRLAASVVNGIQKSGKVAACLKHFVANNQETRRFVVDVTIDERTLREIYLRGFEIAIKRSQPKVIMGSYNSINGTYCCENKWLLDTVLRREWGFKGLVITDWGATNDRVKSIQAGLDLEMPASYGVHNGMIKNALKTGALSLDSLDAVVARVINLISNASPSSTTPTSTASPLAMAMDSSNNNPYFTFKAQHDVAYRMASECAVLLKNRDNALPLKHNVSVTVIGEFAKHPRFQGIGSSMVRATNVDAAFDHISKYTEQLAYTKGYDRNIEYNEEQAIDHDLIQEAVEMAISADVAILFVGLPEISESEGYDRVHLNLPKQHNALVDAVCKVNHHTIVVLTNGGPVAMPWVHQPQAILDTFLAGQAGGSAIADIIFGAISPSGKLTETFPLHAENVPSNSYFPGEGNRVEYREGLNVGYRYFSSYHTEDDHDDVPGGKGRCILFPFGHGLSYTSFLYSGIKTTVTTKENKNEEGQKEEVVVVHTKFNLQNTGAVVASEIVQCYIHYLNNNSKVSRPEIELKEFCKVQNLKPGESKEVQFTLIVSDSFSFYDVGYSKWIVETGQYEIRIGASSKDIKLRSTVDLTAAKLPKKGILCTTIPSPKSQDTSSPSIQQQQASMMKTLPFEINNEQFAQALGRPINNTAQVQQQSSSSSSTTTLFHRNSTLQDTTRTWLGQILIRIAKHTCQQEIGEELPEYTGELKSKLINAVCEDTPLRCLALFGRGHVSFQTVDIIIAIMNGYYWSGLTLIFSSLFDSISSLFGNTFNTKRGR